MTREQAHEFLTKCKENESMNRRPTFTRYEDGYKNGDILPSSRPKCEYIFIDYNNLTLEQIWEIFGYLKGKREILDDRIRSEMICVTKRNSTKIKKVHFNPPVTVVIWEDGTKTIVRTQGKDTFDPEKGLAMAISKRFLVTKAHIMMNLKSGWILIMKNLTLSNALGQL